MRQAGWLLRQYSTKVHFLGVAVRLPARESYLLIVPEDTGFGNGAHVHKGCLSGQNVTANLHRKSKCPLRSLHQEQSLV
jgi:hypothetical protein